MLRLGTSVLRMATPDQLSSRLAATVAASIKAANLSQRAVAEATGIPLVTLSRRLTGHSGFTVPEVAAIADALGVSLVELFLRAERSTSPAEVA